MTVLGALPDFASQSRVENVVLGPLSPSSRSSAPSSPAARRRIDLVAIALHRVRIQPDV